MQNNYPRKIVKDTSWIRSGRSKYNLGVVKVLHRVGDINFHKYLEIRIRIFDFCRKCRNSFIATLISYFWQRNGLVCHRFHHCFLWYYSSQQKFEGTLKYLSTFVNLFKILTSSHLNVIFVIKLKRITEASFLLITQTSILQNNHQKSIYQ